MTKQDRISLAVTLVVVAIGALVAIAGSQGERLSEVCLRSRWPWPPRS